MFATDGALFCVILPFSSRELCTFTKQPVTAFPPPNPMPHSSACASVFGNSTSLFLVELFAGATSPLGKVCKALRHKLADRATHGAT